MKHDLTINILADANVLVKAITIAFIIRDDNRGQLARNINYEVEQ